MYADCEFHAWEAAGRPGKGPPAPGTGDLEPEMRFKEREYKLQKTSYLLRPEVCRSSRAFIYYGKRQGMRCEREDGQFYLFSKLSVSSL